MVQLGLMKAGETMQGADTPAPSVSGQEAATGNFKNEVGVEDKELGFALEMQIQIKRAEREKKRQVWNVGGGGARSLLGPCVR